MLKSALPQLPRWLYCSVFTLCCTKQGFLKIQKYYIRVGNHDPAVKLCGTLWTLRKTLACFPESILRYDDSI